MRIRWLAVKKLRDVTLQELAEHCLLRPGENRDESYEAATRAITTIWRLADLYRELGREPTQHEYATARGVTDRTAQREWKHVKQAFWGQDGPRRLAQLALASKRPLSEGPRMVAALHVPADVAIAAYRWAVDHEAGHLDGDRREHDGSALEALAIELAATA